MHQFFIFLFLHMWLKFDRVALSISVSSFKELWQKSERDEKNGIVWTEASSATWRVSLLQHNIFVQIYTCVHESRKLSCRLLWTSGSLMNIFKLQKIFKFDPFFFFFGLNIIVAIYHQHLSSDFHWFLNKYELNMYMYMQLWYKNDIKTLEFIENQIRRFRLV